jgi:hypothetical protein
MPILAVDKMGRLYETDRDRHDGLGYGSSPEVSPEFGDVTYGSAYLKAGQNRTSNQIKNHMGNKLMENHERYEQLGARKIRAMQQRQEMAEMQMAQNPIVQQNLIKRALNMGCGNVQNTPGTTTNALTTNGMSGYLGMTPDQQNAAQILTGFAPHNAVPVSADDMDRASNEQYYKQLMQKKAMQGSGW